MHQNPDTLLKFCTIGVIDKPKYDKKALTMMSKVHLMLKWQKKRDLKPTIAHINRMDHPNL